MKREFKKYLLPASAFLDNGKVRYHDGRIIDIVDHLAALEVICRSQHEKLKIKPISFI